MNSFDCTYIVAYKYIIYITIFHGVEPESLCLRDSLNGGDDYLEGADRLRRSPTLLSLRCGYDRHGHQV